MPNAQPQPGAGKKSSKKGGKRSKLPRTPRWTCPEKGCRARFKGKDARAAGQVHCKANNHRMGRAGKRRERMVSA